MYRKLLATSLFLFFVLAANAQDLCTGAININCGATVSGNTSSYTADVAPFCGTSDGTGGGLWYKSTATCTAMALTMCASSFDTKLRVYSGTCGALVCVTGIDDNCGLQSQVNWVSTPGTTYYILVHGYGASVGAYTLGLTCSGMCCAGTAPTANFSVPTTVCSGGTAAFTDLSSCSPTSWSWSFPGGTPATSNLQNPVVTYNTVGVYTVTLTATNAVGSDVEIKTNHINVINCAGSCVGNYYYIRSNTQAPWGSNTNELAMNAVYGGGVWTQGFFETVNPAVLFSAATCSIFMEGSDGCATEMEAFLTANGAAMENWVAAGGRLFLNAAPNEDNGMLYGFGGVNLVYNGGPLQGTATAMVPGHQIFNGPFTPVGTTWTANYFSHATLSGPYGTTLIQDGGSIQAAEKLWGAGIVIFGTQTTPNWHSPAPQGQNLRQNILCYLSPPIICGAPVPLPVELLSFQGETVEGVNLLSWTTASEANNDFFTLERGTNGSDFEELAIIDGAGTSTEPIDYLSRDEDLQDAVHYYRLKQTDFDGAFNYSEIVAIDNRISPEVTVFPNPAKESLTVSLSEKPNSSVHISIYNSVGQAIVLETIKQVEIIDVSQLAIGMYLLEITVDGKTTTHKFTKK